MNEGQPSDSKGSKKPAKFENRKPLSERGRVALWSIAIPAICSVLTAVATTFGTIATKKNELGDIQKQSLQVQTNLAQAKEDALQAKSTLSGLTFPVGTVVAYCGPVDEDSLEKEGWLLCDGDPVNRSKYRALFERIRECWGEGDRVNTFNLPDLRGVFLRGVNGDRTDKYRDTDIDARKSLKTGGNDKNRVGSYQEDKVGGHSHSIPGWKNGGGGGIPIRPYLPKGGDPTTFSTADKPDSPGSETQPKNAYVYYLIKY